MDIDYKLLGILAVNYVDICSLNKNKPYTIENYTIIKKKNKGNRNCEPCAFYHICDNICNSDICEGGEFYYKAILKEERRCTQ